MPFSSSSRCVSNQDNKARRHCKLSFPRPWLAVWCSHTCSCWAGGCPPPPPIRAGMSPVSQTPFPIGPSGEAYAALTALLMQGFPSGKGPTMEATQLSKKKNPNANALRLRTLPLAAYRPCVLAGARACFFRPPFCGSRREDRTLAKSSPFGKCRFSLRVGDMHQPSCSSDLFFFNGSPFRPFPAVFPVVVTRKRGFRGSYMCRTPSLSSRTKQGGGQQASLFLNQFSLFIYLFFFFFLLPSLLPVAGQPTMPPIRDCC